VSDRETRIGGAGGAFPTTRASVLASLGALSADGRDPDLERLISIYWKPVYCLLRRVAASSNEDAKDLTQEFFTRVVLGGSLAERYSPDKGSFRAYLKAAVRNFARNERRDAARLKRGGPDAPLSLDVGEIELSALVPDARALPPDELFDAAWRAVLVEKAVQRLRESLAPEVFEVFRRYDLEEDGAGVSYDGVARALGIGADAVKNHLTRAREEFRAAVRALVCGTVPDSADLSAELRELFGA